MSDEAFKMMRTCTIKLDVIILDAYRILQKQNSLLTSIFACKIKVEYKTANSFTNQLIQMRARKDLHQDDNQ